MAPTDLENLLDMGFEKSKAELALKKSGNCRSNKSVLALLSNTVLTVGCSGPGCGLA